MCGIVAYLGQKEALPILISGLHRLEYRGYDSAGVAVFDGNKIHLVRAIGKVDNLAEKLKTEKLNGSIGIAHTRWATHGGVTEANAHPHTDCTGNLVIAHNGIIENYRELKEKFLSGHELKSETDTEVLAHLIEVFYQGNLLVAVQKALNEVHGAYGLVAMHASEPEKIVAARLGSPLVIGVGDGEYFLASDASPILPYTKNIIFLDDGEFAEVTRKEIKVFDSEGEIIDKKIKKMEWDEDQAQKQNYPHFMIKEIFDQPTVFMDAIRGRYTLEEGIAHLDGLNMTTTEMRKVNRIVLIACGTTLNAGIVGKHAFEGLAGIPTEVNVASEFRYSDPLIDENSLVFGISQSGETADTLAALREAKRKGAFVRGIVNVVDSTIARETAGGTYINAGPEFSVGSTKAYTNTVAVLILYALQFGRLRHVSLETGSNLLMEMNKIPEKIAAILAAKEIVRKIAEKYASYRDIYFLGRGINFPVALEGSLKLKELSYIHSEAYPAGEMKHGPLALLTPEFPVIGIVTKNSLYDKMRSSLEEVRARHAPLILIATEGDENVRLLSDNVIYVPQTAELLEPLLNTIPLQLFAYYTAVALGRDVDRPRNLAKSVTVE